MGVTVFLSLVKSAPFHPRRGGTAENSLALALTLWGVTLAKGLQLCGSP